MAPTTTGTTTTQAEEEAELDPLVAAYAKQATKTRLKLERAISDVVAYAQRLNEGAEVEAGDVRAFEGVGKCGRLVSGLRPPPEMEHVQALLEKSCRLMRKSSMELLQAIGTGSGRAARMAGKHMSAATATLNQVRQELEQVG